MKDYPNQNTVFRASRTVLGEVLHLGLNIQVIGKNNLVGINNQNPAIFVFAPHSGHGDSWVVYHVLRENGIRKIMVEAAADHWFKDPKHIITANAIMPAMPYPRKEFHSIQPAQEHIALRMLVEGYSVLTAGEGGRKSTPINERIIKGGFVDLANLSSTPVVPVGIYGYEDVFPKDTHFNVSNLIEGHGRKRITVVIGPPREYELIEDEAQSSIARKQNAQQLRDEFIEMSRHHIYRNK